MTTSDQPITLAELLARPDIKQLLAASERPQEAPEPDAEAPTAPIYLQGAQRRLPPVPVRVRWTTAAVLPLAAAGLVAGDVPVLPSASEPPSATEIRLHVQPTSPEQATAQLGQLVLARFEAERAEDEAVSIQDAADQAELDRRAVEEAERLAAEKEAQEALQDQREAAQAQASRSSREDVTEATPTVSRGIVVPGARVTSGFGSRWGTFHYGIDLAAPLGTPIYTPVSGNVVRAGPASGFGNAVYIQADDGNVYVFGHMRTMNVSAGERVNAGDQIAVVGNEGQSTGPHCHVEVHLGGMGGQRVNPAPYLAL